MQGREPSPRHLARATVDGFWPPVDVWAFCADRAPPSYPPVRAPLRGVGTSALRAGPGGRRYRAADGPTPPRSPRGIRSPGSHAGKRGVSPLRAAPRTASAAWPRGGEGLSHGPMSKKIHPPVAADRPSAN
jgi:hypothetical protein